MFLKYSPIVFAISLKRLFKVIALTTIVMLGNACADNNKYPISFETGEGDNKLIGFKDEKDNVIIKPKFLSVYEFTKNGLASVCDKEGCGYINTKGEYVIKPLYKFQQNFSNENNFPIPVKLKGANNYGYIDSKGEVVIPFQYSRAQTFDSVGSAAVCTGASDNIICGFINIKNEHVVQHIFADVGNYSKNELAYAKLIGETKCGYIDRSGAFIIKPSFYHCSNFELNEKNSLYFASISNVPNFASTVGLINDKGRIVIPDIYQNIFTVYDRNYVKVTLNDKQGILDYSGKEIIKPEYVELNFSQYENEFFAYTASKKHTGYFTSTDAEGCITSNTAYSTDLTPCQRMEEKFAELNSIAATPDRMEGNGEAAWLIWVFKNSPISYELLKQILGILGAVVGFGGVAWTIIRKQLPIFKLVRQKTLARWVQSLALITSASFLLGIWVSETHTNRAIVDFNFNNGFIFSFITLLLLSLLFALVVFITRRIFKKFKK